MMRTNWWLLPVIALAVPIWVGIGTIAFGATPDGFSYSVWDFLAYHTPIFFGGLIGGVPALIAICAILVDE
jgi:hypothetical protein